MCVHARECVRACHCLAHGEREGVHDKEMSPCVWGTDVCVVCKDESERDVSIYITTNFYTDRLVDGFWMAVIVLHFL